MKLNLMLQLFAYCRSGNEWWRTYLIQYITRRQLDVFYIDYGFREEIAYSPPLCQPLPSWFNAQILDSQSYKIALYGVVPITREIHVSKKAWYK